MHMLSYLGYRPTMTITNRLFHDDLNLQNVLNNLNYLILRLKAIDKTLEEDNCGGCTHDIQLVEDLKELMEILLDSHRVTYKTIKGKQLNI